MGFNRKSSLPVTGQLHLVPGKRKPEKKVVEEQLEQLKNLVYLEYLHVKE